MTDSANIRGDGARIDSAIANATPGLWPFIAAGYPSVRATGQLVRELGNLPIRGIEVGIPFSDPIADGPVIQQAFADALSAGARVDAILDSIGGARRHVSQPIIAMVSASIIYRIGMQAFIDRASAVGVDGLIVPDLSLEEAPGLADCLGAAGLRLPMLVAPTTPADRRRRIAAIASGFLYYVSIQGTTGARDALPLDLEGNVQALHEESGMPVLVGFGIGTHQHVRQVCAFAAGAIVGSAIAKRMIDAFSKAGDDQSAVMAATRLIGELSNA